MHKRVSFVSTALLGLLLAPTTASAVPTTNGTALLNEQQQAVCKGTVVDATGTPIIGASVVVKGSKAAAVTDIDGNFTLAGVANGSVIEISYIGFKTQTVTYKGSAINVTLQEDAAEVNEVVVTALGIKRQARSLGYSTTKVEGDAFTLSRDNNLGNALSGKVAGVSVSGNATGSSSRVVIRGNASLTGNNMPLYVVDGVPFDNTNQGSAGTWGGIDMGDGLNNIDADDIESIQVLKGAAASALYGYRGGNGAILITTKSGKKGQPVTVEVNNNLTFNTIYDQRDLQTIYGQGLNGKRPTSKEEAMDSETSSWGDVMDGGDAINFLGNTYKYSYIDNWPNFYRTGINNTTSVAVSGASDKITYRFGYSHNMEKSILPNSGNRQNAINMNTTYQIWKNVSLNVTANYVKEHFNGRSNLSDGNGNTNASLLYHGNSFDIRWLERQSAGNEWGTADDGSEFISGTNVYFNNPYWLQYRKTNNADKSRLTGAINLKWDITPWLYLQGAVQRDGYNLEYKQVQPTGAAADPNGFMTEYEKTKTFEEMNYNFLLGFNKEFGDWSVGATFGGNKLMNSVKYYYVSNGGRPFVVDGLWSVNNLESKRSEKVYTRYQVNSFYGTVDLGWKNQVFLNLTGRNDWFSTLSEDNNSYFYPSATLSWVFTDTFKAPSWFNFGKLRASYAAASNGTSAYQNLLLYKIQDFTINNQQTVTENNNGVYPNKNLKPVHIAEYEVGLNLAFLNNRLNFDMAYYNKKTTDDIAVVSTSSASGYNSKVENVGEIRNRGFEFMVDATPVANRNFSWNTTLNFAYNDSKVLYLGEGVKNLMIDGATSRSGNVSVMNIVGSAYGELVGYKYKRAENGELLLKNGLPQSTGVQESLGNGVYKWTGGWHNTIKYKNFTLAFLIDFKFGAKLFSGTNLSLTSSGLSKNTLVGRTEENPDGPYVFPGIDEDTGKENTTAVAADLYYSKIVENNIGEAFIYNASFIKLREISLTYDFTRLIQPKLPFIKGLSLSFVGRNLWTIKKWVPNIDPESSYNTTNGQGLELNGYPYTRSLGFNVNVKF